MTIQWTPGVKGLITEKTIMRAIKVVIKIIMIMVIIITQKTDIMADWKKKSLA